MFKIAASVLVATQLLVAPLARAEVFSGNLLNGCVENFDPNVDYFPLKYKKPFIVPYGDIDIFGEKFEPHNTTDFLEITYHKTYKIVTNRFQDKSYLLYQCGTLPPQDEVDSGRHHLVLPIPHQGGVALTETVQIPPMELLGLREEIIAYIGDPQWISSPCLTHMIEEATLETVWEGWNQTLQSAATADFLARNPDAIIIGGPYGDKDGDRVLSVAASQERTNVATFDWIALYAALFNLEGMSNKIVSDTQAQYECSSDNARVIASQQRRVAEDEKPVLLWANWIQGYNWSVAECPTWDTTYYCEYAAHCGVDIISRPEGLGWNDPSYGGNYWYLNDEEMLELGKDADVWIYSSQFWDTMYAEKKDVVDQFKSVQNQQVYDTQGMGPNSWYEQRLAEYDVVGLDMCDVVGHTNKNGPAHDRRWLRNIFTDPIGQLEECRIPDELSEPYIPGGADCVRLEVQDSESGSSSGSANTPSIVLGWSLLLSAFVLGL
jgi:iron complex transport system substrate-binding protein